MVNLCIIKLIFNYKPFFFIVEEELLDKKKTSSNIERLKADLNETFPLLEEYFRRRNPMFVFK